MTRVVLSIGSNLGDRLVRLQSVLDGLDGAVAAVSAVYETDPWGGVEQEPFLNAVVIADDPDRDAYAWLRRAQEFEQAAERVRELRWGPRTLDVDLIACYQNQGEVGEVILNESDLTLPHPRAHRRAFVMVPWLDVDPAAELTLAGGPRPVDRTAGRAGTRRACGCAPDPADAGHVMGPTRKRDLTAVVLGATVVGYLLITVLYRSFPPITVWSGASLLVVAVAEALWARNVRAKINDGEIGDGPGWLHPLAVARSLVVAKASAWVGALVLGWWLGVLVYCLPRRSWLRAAAEDTSGTAVAADQCACAGRCRALAAALLQVPATGSG